MPRQHALLEKCRLGKTWGDKLKVSDTVDFQGECALMLIVSTALLKLRRIVPLMALLTFTVLLLKA